MQYSTTEEKSSSNFLDNAKYILGNANRVFSYIFGFSISVFSGDLFYKYQEPIFFGNNCEYVFSINGVGNSLSDIYDQNGWINSIGSIVLSGPNEDRPSYNHIDNYSSGVADFIQAVGDELDFISISSIRAARSINKAGEDAEIKCNCYKIYVVAHSQGTGVFKNALPLIKPEYRKHITFLGFGGQFFANSFWGVSEFHNFANIDDIIPMYLNFSLPYRSHKGFFASMHRNTHFKYDGGWGLSHKFNAHYLDYFKTYWENRPRLKNGGK